MAFSSYFNRGCPFIQPVKPVFKMCLITNDV